MIMRLKPSSSKGIYMKNLAVSSTMGVGIKVDMASLKEAVK
jgi:large subunit ribosomal protein L1